MNHVRYAVFAISIAANSFQCAEMVLAQRQMERLDRGVVAIRQADGGVFVGWRLFGNDPDGIAFNVYRRHLNGEPVKLNEAPIKDVTFFVDDKSAMEDANKWFVRSVVLPSPSPSPERRGEPIERDEAGESLFPAKTPTIPYISIPLQTPPGYTPNDASVGDLDGDGEYEIVVHQVGRGRDNSQDGHDRRRSSRPTRSTARGCGRSTWAATFAKAPITRSSWSTTWTATAGRKLPARRRTARSTAGAR